MSLEHAQLVDLLEGRRSVLWIASMPVRIRDLLGCSTGAVYLSRSSALHVLERHPDFDSYGLLVLPHVIEKGRHFREPHDPKKLQAIWTDDADRTLFAALKVAAGGHELWVSSLYRIRPRDLRAKMKRLVEL